MYALISKQSSITKEEAITTSSSWGTDEGSSSSTASANELTNGWNASVQWEYSWQVGTGGAKVVLGAGYNGQYAVSTERTISTDRRKSYNDGVESLKSRSTTESFDISGGKLSVALGIKNVSDIGFSLSNLTYNLYGIKYFNGKAVETLISTLPAALADLNFSLAPGGSSMFKLDDVGITNQEMDEFGKYNEFKAEVAAYNAVFNPASAQELKTSDVMSTVNASCARVEVDFDENGSAKESPFIRYVATKTKWIEETKSYGPTYLGELLHAMGIQYEMTKKDGIISILDVKKNDRHGWCVVHSKRGVAGTKSDTLYGLTGSFSSPESVIVNAGDAIVIIYSGDNENDGVMDYIERRYGTYARNKRDSDDDGLSDSSEIYGHKFPNDETDDKLDSITVTSNPLKQDSDLDGESDFVDHSPLKANKDPGGKLVSITFQREDTDLTILRDDFKTFNSAWKSHIANKPTPDTLGTRIRFKVKLDGDPKVADVLVNGIPNIKLIRNEESKFENIYDAVVRAGFDSAYDLSKTNSVCIHLVSGDEKYDSTYCVLGTSFVGTPTKSPTPKATLDNRKPWKILHPSVDVKSHLTADPRTTGILLYRHNVASNADTDTVDSFPGLVKSRSLPDFGEMMNDRKFSLVGMLGGPELAGGIFDMSDSFNVLAGGNYSYFTVPYVEVNDNYYFGKATKRSLPTQTPQIHIKAVIPFWHCVETNDGTAHAEMITQLQYSKKLPNQAWAVLKELNDLDEWVEDDYRRDVKLSYLNSDWQETDTIGIHVLLTEDDAGAGNGNDDNWNSTFVKMEVKQLLELTSVSARSAEDGYIFDRNISADENNITFTPLNTPFSPTETNQSIIHWWGHSWANPGAESNMRMEFDLSWYIK